MTRFTVVALILAGSLPAFAQDKPDLLKDFKYGDRVEVTLKSNFGIMGELIPTTVPEPQMDGTIGDREIELSQATNITLDISLEYPELGGRKAPESGKFLPNVFGFERVQLKGIRKLPQLTPEQVAAREKAREEALARTLAEENKRRQEEAEREARRIADRERAIKEKKLESMKTAEGKLRAEAEALEQARALYKKFPPEAGWGKEKKDALLNKSNTFVPLTPEEKEFLQSYDEWLKYKNQLEGENKENKDGQTPK